SAPAQTRRSAKAASWRRGEPQVRTGVVASARKGARAEGGGNTRNVAGACLDRCAPATASTPVNVQRCGRYRARRLAPQKGSDGWGRCGTGGFACPAETTETGSADG